MGELIQFPGVTLRDVIADEQLFAVQTTIPEHCDGMLHIFDEVPGTCRCGSETWTLEHGLESLEDGVIGIHHVA